MRQEVLLDHVGPRSDKYMRYKRSNFDFDLLPNNGRCETGLYNIFSKVLKLKVMDDVFKV